MAWAGEQQSSSGNWKAAQVGGNRAAMHVRWEWVAAQVVGRPNGRTGWVGIGWQHGWEGAEMAGWVGEGKGCSLGHRGVNGSMGQG